MGELRKPKYEVIIISDSNTEFIECIMEAAGHKKLIKAIYTNPAVFDERGCLQISYYHDQDWCKLSTRNLCKGHILDEHINKARDDRNITFSHVAYVGDGHNDLCPSLRLRAEDVTFPREGYTLIKEIQKLERGKLKCNMEPWDTGHKIMEYLAKLDNNIGVDPGSRQREPLPPPTEQGMNKQAWNELL